MPSSTTSTAERNVYRLRPIDKICHENMYTSRYHTTQIENEIHHAAIKDSHIHGAWEVSHVRSDLRHMMGSVEGPRYVGRFIPMNHSPIRRHL
jgi:hypothetical protein